MYRHSFAAPVADSSSRKQAFGLRKIERSIFFGDTSEVNATSLLKISVFYSDEIFSILDN